MRRAVAGCLAFCALVAPLRAQERAGEQEAIGHLLIHVRDTSGQWHQRTTPYMPREGDLVFFNDHSRKWGILYKLVGSDAPYHVGLVFKKPDGQCAIAEAGPNDTLRCRVLELAPRLHGWEHTLQIRSCKAALTPEQSAAMTNWALAQDGKRYALGRLLLQATPVRCRAPLRRSLFGATYTDRDSYLCAELVIAGGTVGGIFNPQLHKGNTIYPRDIIQDDIHDLSQLYHEARIWLPQKLAEK
jgi:hypothetical protein